MVASLELELFFSFSFSKLFPWMCKFAYLTDKMPASVHTQARGKNKGLARISSGHLWILFNSSFFHLEHVAGGVV